MTFDGGEEAGRPGSEGSRPREADPGEPRPETRRGRGGPRFPWLLALGLGLVALLLAAGIVFLLRSFGDTLSGTSVARDSLNSGPEPRVRLVNGPGQVSVEGVEDLRSVEYEVTRYAVAGDPAAAKERAATVTVDVEREEEAIVLRTDGGRNTGADYAVRVPAGASVEVESSAGDVEVAGVGGDVRITAGAGDVAVRDVRGSVSLEVPQGDAAVSGVNTDTGQAEITTGSGDVLLEDVVVGTLEATVEAGDVELAGRFSGGGRIFVQTGDIIARLPPEDTRELVLETRVGEVVRGEPSGEPEERTAAEGDG